MSAMATHGVLSLPSGPRSDSGRGGKTWTLEHQYSIIDDLLFEIYDRWHDGKHDSFESDTFTECSSTSEAFHWRRSSIHSDTHTNSGRLHQASLETQSIEQLRKLVSELQHRTNFMSSRLVRQLKRRERRQNKLQHNCDIVTAILQAASQKRRIDTRLRFNLEPPLGDSAFDQWKDAMQAVARLPLGIPDGFRKKVWLSLAENHIRELRIDWERTVRFVFNERSNPDDNTLGLQIVKDLHRTGCSGFSGQDNEEDRAVLKRVLLAYARWNKTVGYCQGFNVIAALLLEVMERKEDEALMVMIYLIDHVLPDSYFANNLRALSVDMAVFRDLLGLMFPKLSKHLDYLQYAAQDQATGASYEPPLTNVFTMQWFLTMFATCLPKDVVLRVWDSILLEGSEILLRTALAIWGKLSRRILSVGSADEFYSLMGVLTQDMMEGRMFDADALIKFIYSCAPFPMQQLPELREKYTYNIRPFSSAGGSKKANVVGGMVLPSDDDDLDEDDLEAITCFTGILPGQIGPNKSKGTEGETSGSVADISVLGPGAYGANPEASVMAGSNLYLERMSTDISSLKKQYRRLKQRQAQAHIILAAASAKQHSKPRVIVPKIETPKAMNHLFVGKNGTGGKNRLVTDSPRISTGYPQATVVHHYLQEVKKQKSPSRKARRTSEASTVSERSNVERLNSVDSAGSVSDKSVVERLNPVESAASVCEQSGLDVTESETSSHGATGQENSETIISVSENKHSCDQDYTITIPLVKDTNEEEKKLMVSEVTDFHCYNFKLIVEDEITVNDQSGKDQILCSPSEESECNQATSDNTYVRDQSSRQEHSDSQQKSFSSNNNSNENNNVESQNTTSSIDDCGNLKKSTVEKGSESCQESSGIIPESQGCEIDSRIGDSQSTSSESNVTAVFYSLSKSPPDELSEEKCDSLTEIQNCVKMSANVNITDGSEFNGNVTSSCNDNNSNIQLLKEEEDQNHSSKIILNSNQQHLLEDHNMCSSDSDIESGDIGISKLNQAQNNRGSVSDSELSSIMSPQDSEFSKHLTDSDSCSVFSPESASERCFSYSERSASDRSLSQSSQESTLSSQINSGSSECHLKSGSLETTSDSNITNAGVVKHSENSSKRKTNQAKKDTVLSNQAISEHLGNYSKSKSALASAKTAKPFSPFPVRHFNENRAKTGLKLGMYKVGTIEQMGKQTKRKALWSK